MSTLFTSKNIQYFSYGVLIPIFLTLIYQRWDYV